MIKIALALAFIIFYWFIDSIHTVSILSIPFTQALTSNFISKILVTAVTLTFVLFSQKKEQIKNEKSLEEDKFQVYKKVAQIVTSPLTITSQANQIVTLLESNCDIACSFICEYHTEKIKLLNNQESLQKFGIKQSYNAHSEAYEKGSIDEILTLFFLERRDYLETEVQTPKGIFKAYFYALMAEKSTKPFGLFVVLSNTQNNYAHLTKSISSLIAFSLFFHQRKVASEEFQKQLLQKDIDLNIPTNTVLQTIIQQEYDRFLRYGTNLSLIIIEIDYFENLQNIFDKDSILSVQKELVRVISRNIRTNDTLGKWTQNRFAIIAPMIDFRSTKNFILKLKRVLEAQRFHKVGKLTCTYGATSLAQGDTIVQFRQRAEEALKEALEKGNNTYQIKVIV